VRVLGGTALRDKTKVDSFTEFVREAEPRLRRALTAAFGAEVGREAAAEALVYGWKHWDRVREMENAAGYLYRVGRDRGRHVPKPAGRLDVDAAAEKVPWVEPRLPGELRRLPERQRIVFTLIHGYEWTFAEVAELLDLTKATVQTHERRAMNKLRKRLGVDNAD
jgi:RNA polymerase sigma-70 factor (ECF subfamily)